MDRLPKPVLLMHFSTDGKSTICGSQVVSRLTATDAVPDCTMGCLTCYMAWTVVRYKQPPVLVTAFTGLSTACE